MLTRSLAGRPRKEASLCMQASELFEVKGFWLLRAIALMRRARDTVGHCLWWWWWRCGRAYGLTGSRWLLGKHFGVEDSPLVWLGEVKDPCVVVRQESREFLQAARPHTKDDHRVNTASAALSHCDVGQNHPSTAATSLGAAHATARNAQSRSCSRLVVSDIC